jgi:hypothetical protein
LSVAALAAALVAGAAWLLQPGAPPRIANVRPLGIDVGEFVRPRWPTWTTDGVRLYYVARKGDRFVLYNVALAGGEPSEIPTPFGLGLELYGYLHGRSSLVALGRSPGEPPLETGVWLIPVPQGSPRRLGDGNANAIAVSPDEERLALTIFEPPRGARIMFLRLDDPDAPPYAELRLPECGARSWHFRASWSPDGDRFRFSAPGPVGHEDEIWLWETSDAAETPKPLWPGDGGVWLTDRSHFVSERARRVDSRPRSDLFVVGGGSWSPWSEPVVTWLTSGPVSFTEVGLNPDGTGLLAFGEVRRGELQRFDRKERRFEPALEGESVGFVEYSRDGEWVAWVTYPEETLWRGRSDGTERLQLTRPPDRAVNPAWSPDGSQIAYVSVSDRGRRSLCLASVDEGRIEVVEKQEGFPYSHPCWLSNGTLLFSSRSIFRLGLHRLDPSGGTTTPLEGADDLLFPSCGPQGQVVAGRLRGDDLVTVVRWAGDDDWEEVGAFLAYSTWTRDGQAFCGIDNRATRIECYSARRRGWETLVEIDRPLVSWWASVPWMGLDAEDNPLVMFDRSTRDLCALEWEAP